MKFCFNNLWLLITSRKFYNRRLFWNTIIATVLLVGVLLSVLQIQKPVTEAKNVAVENSSNFLRVETDFNKFLLQPRGKCCKLVSIGGISCKGQSDGNKQVCLDDHLWIGTEGCLVYSFGISDETSFEEFFWDWKHCEFHLFDPTIQEDDLPLKLRTKKHHFHQLGILNKNIVMMVQSLNKTAQEFATFGSILKLLKHQNRIINYLKMDVEGSEWNVLLDMLQDGSLKNVLQFNVEIHLKSLLIEVNQHRWLSVLQEKYDLLSRIGASSGELRRVSYHPNIFGRCVLRLEENSTLMHPVCGELLFVRS